MSLFFYYIGSAVLSLIFILEKCTNPIWSDV
jgi:hypothetical protein